MKKLIIFLLLYLGSAFAQSEKVKIAGEYSYTYGDNESLIEAKEICYTMALRNAIETYQVFITSTATVKDYKMIKDLVKTISFGHVQDVKVIEEKISGRNINYKIEGYINPIEIKNVLSREINKAKKRDTEGVMENEYIIVLSVKEDLRNNKLKGIRIFYKQKKVGGLFPYYPKNLSKYEKYSVIAIDWFDANGDPINTDLIHTKEGLFVNMYHNIYCESQYEAKSYQLKILELSDIEID